MKKRTGIKIAVGIIVVILFVVAGMTIIRIVEKLTPNKEQVSAVELYPVAAGEAHLFVWQNQYEKNALYRDRMDYLDQETVQALLHTDFYFDEKEQLLSYVKPTEIIRILVGEDGYYVNKERVALSAPAVLLEGEMLYYSLELLTAFADVRYQFYPEPDRVLLSIGSKDLLYMSTTKATALRERPDLKARVIFELTDNTRVLYAEGEGDGENGYLRVMTEEGIYGYIRKKDLTETFYETITSTWQEPEFTHLLSEEKVILGWHQVTTAAANKNLEGLIKSNEQMNVISPTWFRLSTEAGTVSSIAEEDYVSKAKEYGLSVWGLVDNFDSSVSTYAVLSSTSAREHLVEELISLALKYQLDGINIDFENLSLETGPHFIQFLRELSVRCRVEGLVLSVDNYVPTDYAAYYDWRSQGKVVDYVVIMAYDEHYAGSPVAGSVASYGYLTKAVDDILTMVAKEQVIMAVPFYTRLWTEKETPEGTKLSSAALSMQIAENELKKNKITAEWDDVTKQYYAEYRNSSGLNKIWLEEKDSLREKLLYIKNAELAGAAVWRLGLEKPEVWELFDFETLAPLPSEEDAEEAQ